MKKLSIPNDFFLFLAAALAIQVLPCILFKSIVLALLCVIGSVAALLVHEYRDN